MVDHHWWCHVGTKMLTICATIVLPCIAHVVDHQIEGVSDIKGFHPTDFITNMNSTSSGSAEKEIRQSLLYAVGSICEDYAMKQQQERTATHRARPVPSKATLAILADLLYSETEILATELQHFAHHANRKVIKPEDVILMARKDPEMMRSLQKFQRDHLPSAASKKRRRGGGDE